jgi:hypothetical protein
MKNNKKIYGLAVFALLVFCQKVVAMTPQKMIQHVWGYEFPLVGLSSVNGKGFGYKLPDKAVAQESILMGPIDKTVADLFGQKHSKKTSKVILDVVKYFFDNQIELGRYFEQVIQDQLKGMIVEGFNIPKKNMEEIVGKLSCFGVRPVFYRSLDSDFAPQLVVVKAFRAIGFSMNSAAEKAFWNTHKKSADGVNFNCDQMEVLVDHECLHIQNGDGDLKVLFRFLSQQRKSFSDEEFYTIMGAFGEQFLRYRPSLIAAITKEAKEMGIHDFSKIEAFDMDRTAFERYSEVRVDEMILASKDKKKIQAYRDYYKARNDFQPLKERMALDQANIAFCLKKPCTIPLKFADFINPTDQERVDACDKALAELKVAKK